MYDYDSNAILVQAIQNRKAQTIAQAWEKLTKRINRNRKRFNNFILDNEISTELKKPSRNIKSNTNVYHQTYTEEMQQNGPFRLSKITY